MPPYCGLPRLSHQFPVALVVVTLVVAVVVVVTFGVVAVVTIAVVGVVVVDVIIDDVVVDLLQDTKSKETTIRKVINTQVTLFFTYYSFVISRLPKN